MVLYADYKRLLIIFLGTADQYELGDLGDKYGLLEGSTTVKTFFNETQLSLFGPYSILGRSVVLHKKVIFQRYGEGDK